VLDDETPWLLAGDEVVVSKSGKKTHGLDRFFSSVVGKTIPVFSEPIVDQRAAALFVPVAPGADSQRGGRELPESAQGGPT
jgi:hypothetical protein